MITMEFEEMKKIWDSQNGEALYSINEKALHNRIMEKMNQSRKIVNISELLLIIVNICGGLFILGINIFKQNTNIFMYLLSAWMFITALYFLMSRIRRVKNSSQFDRSMYGDLNHAISEATYQVRLSLFGRWNIIPIGIFTLLGIWEGGKSVWMALGVLIFFLLVNYATGLEHGIYKRRKRELEVLKSKLEDAR